MGDNVHPCIIYQRLRPSAPEASQYANEHIWPLADELVDRDGYSVCGLYGDSEFAPPFCGGSEFRPGFALALGRARAIAARLGLCTLLIGNADAIGDGDPFLPPLSKVGDAEGVHVRVANFYLRSHAGSTCLRAAWRYFEEYKSSLTRAALFEQPLTLTGSDNSIELIIRRDPGQHLARLYLANPDQVPIIVKWRRLMQQHDAVDTPLECPAWSTLKVPGRCAAYLDTVFQGDLQWVRHCRSDTKLGAIAPSAPLI